MRSLLNSAHNMPGARNPLEPRHPPWISLLEEMMLLCAKRRVHRLIAFVLSLNLRRQYTSQLARVQLRARRRWLRIVISGLFARRRPSSRMQCLRSNMGSSNGRVRGCEIRLSTLRIPRAKAPLNTTSNRPVSCGLRAATIVGISFGVDHSSGVQVSRFLLIFRFVAYRHHSLPHQRAFAMCESGAAVMLSPSYAAS